MFERFTDRARRVLVLAQEEARLFRHDHIGTEHLLLGLIGEGDGIAGRALSKLGVSLASGREGVAGIIGRGSDPSVDPPPFTLGAKRALERSLREAIALGHQYIGTEHVLRGIVGESEDGACRVLVAIGVDPADVVGEAMALLARLPEGRHPLEAVAGDDVEPTEPGDATQLLPAAEASEVLVAAIAAEPWTQRTEIDGVVYDTCGYEPALLPEILVSVAGARVSRQAFDGYTERLPKSSPIEGLGDAATYDLGTHSLRMLVGTTLVVVQVRRHGERRRLAVDIARRISANLTPGS